MKAAVSFMNLHHSINEEPKPVSVNPEDVLAGVRKGDAAAELQFARIYSDGIRFYLRRNLGAEDLEHRVRQVLNRLLERVRGGWTPREGELAAILAEQARVWKSSPLRGQPSHARVQLRSDRLKRALEGCSKREIEMLIRYYVNGESLDGVTATMDVTAEEFLSLKWRLRRAASSETGKKPVAMQASAGSF